MLPDIHLPCQHNEDHSLHRVWGYPIVDAPSLICEAVDSSDSSGGSGGGPNLILQRVCRSRRHHGPNHQDYADEAYRVSGKLQTCSNKIN